MSAPRPFSQTRRREVSFVAVLMYKQVLQSSSKCFFSLTRASPSLGFPSFAPLLRVWASHSLQKTKEKTAFRSHAHSRLPPTFVLPSVVSGGAGTGPAQRAALRLGSRAGPGRLRSRAPGGDVEKAGDHHEVRLAEVTALQALRHALQRFQVLAPGNPAQNLLQVNCKEGEAR